MAILLSRMQRRCSDLSDPVSQGGEEGGRGGGGKDACTHMMDEKEGLGVYCKVCWPCREGIGRPALENAVEML